MHCHAYIGYIAVMHCHESSCIVTNFVFNVVAKSANLLLLCLIKNTRPFFSERQMTIFMIILLHSLCLNLFVNCKLAHIYGNLVSF